LPQSSAASASNVRGNFLERLNAGRPRLILVVAGDQISALMADRQLGDVLRNGEAGHHSARGSA
jgi:hypothetical protein